MKCQFCNEEGIRQSFSEVGGGYVVQATCGACGAGWCVGTFNQEQGDAMRAAQAEAEVKAAIVGVGKAIGGVSKFAGAIKDQYDKTLAAKSKKDE